MVTQCQNSPKLVENLQVHVIPAVGHLDRVRSSHDPLRIRTRVLLELDRQTQRRERIACIEALFVGGRGLQGLFSQHRALGDYSRV